MILALACLAGLTTSAALAQAPGEVASDPGPETGIDTEYTPVAKESQAWTRIGGAEFGEEEVPPDSPTPYTVDFFTVDFVAEDLGYAGGAACADPATPFEELQSCERVPVIWRYSLPDGDSPRWEEVYRGEGRGFVGAISFIDREHVLAVGGTGHYPRRELSREPTESDPDYAARDLAGDEPNAAGAGRAWLLSGGGWQELTELPETETEAPMVALTALDCSPNPKEPGFCVAGGRQQLWHWRTDSAHPEGAFVESYTRQSPPARFDDAAGFRFRVRDLRFLPDLTGVHATTPTIVAVTSGCCATDVSNNSARIVLYRDGTWYARRLRDEVLDPSGGAGRGPLPPQSIPDSFYGVNVTPMTPEPQISVIATPGGAASPGGPALPEPPSSVIGGVPLRDPAPCPLCIALIDFSFLSTVPVNPHLSTARLHAADGDFVGGPQDESGKVFGASENTARPDGTIDWAVGALGSSGQAIAYTTTDAGSLYTYPLDCGVLNASLSCPPKPPDEQEQGRPSRGLVELPSYALNGFRYVPESSIAWAVGDKGALMRLGGEGTVGAEPPELAPPKLGAGKLDPGNDDSAYESSRPGTPSRTGSVPALRSQPLEQLEVPELAAAGTPLPGAGPDDRPASDPGEHPLEIVSSRDGAEAWAIGGSETLALSHFDGERWERCDPVGIDHVLDPDPACESLGSLYSDDDREAPFRLAAAARVPLELDDDPTNDDEFELLAVGTRFDPPGPEGSAPAILRYSKGRWSLDPAAMAVAAGSLPPMGFTSNVSASVAFVAPDDGWIYAPGGTGSAGLLHFDGEAWIDCRSAREDCGDPDGRLPLAGIETSPAGLLSAGERIYLYATRSKGVQGTSSLAQPRFPAIVYRDPGGTWTAEGGGYDPGFGQGSEATADQGSLDSVSVTRLASGEYAGWAVGSFGGSAAGAEVDRAAEVRPLIGNPAGVLRLNGGSWQRWSADDATADYLPLRTGSASVLSTVGPDGEERTFITPPVGGNRPFPLLRYDAAESRWKALETPFVSRFKVTAETVEGSVSAIGPDSLGGIWLAATPLDPFNHDDFFYRYTDRAPAEVFKDAPHPVRERITALAGTASGTVWVTTASGVVYRYDRLTGWERFSVPGWDPGQVVTRTSAANAIAVGPGGEGLLVGEGGRIAKLGNGGVQLDRAAGTVCDRGAIAPPCGTGRSLHAASIAPDGSAIVAGEAKALLWRPAGGQFSAIAPPSAAPNATFTGVSMPSPERAYLTTDTGQVWAGQGLGAGWSWRLESLGEELAPLTRSADAKNLVLSDIVVDAAGRGLAVGQNGLVLERTGDAEHPWRRIDTGFEEDLFSAALPPQGMGDGALIGGALGLVLTRTGGRFEVAHRTDYFDPRANVRFSNDAGRIVGVAAMPGVSPGHTEAWAAMQVSSGRTAGRAPAPGALLHYTSDPRDPLLDATGGRAAPLADAPPPRPHEVAFAAFGDSECDLGGHPTCPETHGTNLLNEVLARRIAEEIETRARAADGPGFALFTGEISKGAGREKDFDESVALSGLVNTSLNSPLDTGVVQRRWVEQVEEDYLDRGVPLFAALGGRDLAGADSCSVFTSGSCHGGGDAGGAGTSEPWRESMAGMPAPWGDGTDAGHSSLAFEPVEVSGPEAPGGGASTHYAFDAVDTSTGELPLRVVVLDSSLRSLAASDANQNPVEEQTAWLENVLCRRGSATDTGECTREAGAAAIVVSNTPTYTYGPGTTETALDSAQLEEALLRHEVSALVSGRVGWNGLYYALAPGVHTPEPGGDYPSESPQPLAPGGGVLPGVVAASAGGRFGPSGQDDGSAADGYWHGYSIVRVTPDPSETIVEQRPILDWVGIGARDRALSPRRRLALEGYGREALGTDTTIRYAEIDSAAITHRYDLLLADPDQPWLPCREGDPGCESLAANLSQGEAPAENGCDPYLCLPERVGTVDRTTGEVRAGDGRYPQTFGLAMLSVGARSATYPLVFERSPSFVVKSALRTPGLPLAAKGSAPAPPAPPNPPTPPRVPQIDLPAIPEPPAIPPMEAAQPPEPQPPAPPAPPPPSQQPAPLDLSVAPAGLTLSTPTAVIQPPTPPVNPVPPSGARREARQRQAAAQKSGADAEAREDVAGSDVDQATEKHALPGAEMTRIEHSFTATARPRRDPSFTAYRPTADSSPLGPGALYAGGITLLAFALASGWSRGRPTPRRREPELPAPAWASRHMESRWLRPERENGEQFDY